MTATQKCLMKYSTFGKYIEGSNQKSPKNNLKIKPYHISRIFEKLCVAITIISPI
jgi:hypothetical protein